MSEKVGTTPAGINTASPRLQWTRVHSRRDGKVERVDVSTMNETQRAALLVELKDHRITARIVKHEIFDLEFIEVQERDFPALDRLRAASSGPDPSGLSPETDVSPEQQ